METAARTVFQLGNQMWLRHGTMAVIICIVALLSGVSCLLACFKRQPGSLPATFTPPEECVQPMPVAGCPPTLGRSKTLVLCPHLVVPRESECTMILPAHTTVLPSGSRTPGVLPVWDKSGNQLLELVVPLDFRTSVVMSASGVLSRAMPSRDRQIYLATKRGEILARCEGYPSSEADETEGHMSSAYSIYAANGRLIAALSREALTSYSVRDAEGACTFTFVGHVAQLALNVFDADGVVVAATKPADDDAGCSPAPLLAQIRVAADIDVGLLLLAFACILDLQRDPVKT